MNLYTRKGDDGRTVLLDGTRVSKSDGRIAAFGLVDEINAHLGIAVSLASTRRQDPLIATIQDRLSQIQAELFSLGAELAAVGTSKAVDDALRTRPEQATRLEAWIDDACKPLPPLNTFVLPGGDPLASQLHVCRTVCRRAERAVVALAAQQPVNANALVYLNRLSDLLFAWSRLANHTAGKADVPWVKPQT